MTTRKERGKAMSDVRERLYSAKEAVAILGISRPTLSRLLRRNAIGHFRIGTRTLFSAEHINAFLASVEQVPKEPRRTKAAARR
jgi:excisionase family DNA binding protein